MAELHEVREPEGGEGALASVSAIVSATALNPWLEPGPCAREARELGVGGGEEDDVARGLAEVDRLGLVDRRSRLRAQQVHRSPPPPGPAARPPGPALGRPPVGGSARPEHLPDAGLVEPRLPDHHQPRAALLAGPPLPVVVVPDPLADPLHEQAHVLARHRREPLDAEDPVRSDGAGDPARERVRAIDLAQLDAERREVVMVVFPLLLVEVGGAGVEVVLRRRPEPEGARPGPPRPRARRPA